MMLSPSESVQHALARAVIAAERWRHGVAYDPLSHRIAQDPYPMYARIREQRPVHWSRLLNAWIVSRYADIDAILRDHRRFGSDPRKAKLTRMQKRRMPPEHELTMLTLDPPDHTRLRALISKAFTRGKVHALEPRMRRIIAGLLDDIEDPEAFDLMAAVAKPLPVIVIAEILGIPREDRAQFARWSRQRARLLEPTVSMQARRIADRASREFNHYVRQVIAQRHAAPRDDILSTLVQAEEEGERLTEQEVLNTVRMLLVGGIETTTNLIGNGMLALLRHPEELERLRAEPDLMPEAVEELLRYDAPAQATFRRVLQDAQMGGIAMERGATIVLLMGAANRDPEVFETPDKLDIGRTGGPHLSMSRGIHHCLGAALARLEGRIALEMLLERFPTIELLRHRPLHFTPNVVLRGLGSLPLRCSRA